MYTVDIDFEVYKQLTVLRQTEDVTYNDVIRDLLGLSGVKEDTASYKSDLAAPSSWVSKGVTFPSGTEFRGNYKGQTHIARVENGALVLNGQSFSSPSAAAVSITKGPINGWRFWECRLPGKTSWRLIDSLRS